MNKIISFSLFGNDPIYQHGALQNLKLSREIYPEWICRFYVSQEISKLLLDKLKKGGAQVIIKVRKSVIDGTFWRFLPASENDLDALIVRDADSLITEREALAVNEWLNSGKGFHIMRDHPNHQSLIMGGMWGCRGRVLPSMKMLIWRWQMLNFLVGKSSFDNYGMDQAFLSQMVYSRIKSNVLIHSEFVLFENEKVRPFPEKRKKNEFVGQRFNENNTIMQRYLFQLEQAENNQNPKVYPIPPTFISKLKRKLLNWSR
jgi:protein O-GlcNAc transferase